MISNVYLYLFNCCVFKQATLKRKHWNPAETASKRCTDLFKRQMGAAQAQLDAQNPDNDPKPSRGAAAKRKSEVAAAADTDAARLQVRGFGPSPSVWVRW